MISEPPSEDREVLSPELVLVSSPEDARRAREQFRERPGALPFAPAAPVQAEPVVVPQSPSAPPVAAGSAAAASVDRAPPPAYPRVVLEDLAPEPPRRLRRGRIALAVGLLGALAVGAYLIGTRWPAGRTAHDAAAQSVQSTITSPSTRTRLATPSTGLADGQKQQTMKPPPKRPAAFVPARTWVWSPQAGADAYEVTVFLDGRKVLRAQPATSRFVLPSSFRFRAGRYRWTVRPLPATATAKPIVDSTFVLTPVAAAAANGS